MKQFKERLTHLVCNYAVLISGNYETVKQFQPEVLESAFIGLVAETLSTPPLSDESIKQQAKKLFLQFHSDKYASFSPETRWLEFNLSKGLNDGACFKIITLCKDRLLSKQAHFEEVHNVDDLKNTFEQLKKQASTQIQAAFHESVINYLNEAAAYEQKIAHIQQKNIKLAMQFLPFFCPNYLIVVFHTELIALYAVSALSTIIGYTTKKIGGETLDAMGNSMINVGFHGFTGTNIAVIRIYEMSHWLCANGYELALLPGIAVLKSLQMRTVTTPSYQFQTEILNKLMNPFQLYLKANDQQFFRDARLGAEKHQAVVDLLKQALIIDKEPLSDATKSEKMKTLIDNLVLKKKLNNKRLASAIGDFYCLYKEQTRPLLLMSS